MVKLTCHPTSSNTIRLQTYNDSTFILFCVCVFILVRRNQDLLSDPKGKYVTETLLTPAGEEKIKTILEEITTRYARNDVRFQIPNIPTGDTIQEVKEALVSKQGSQKRLYLKSFFCF